MMEWAEEPTSDLQVCDAGSVPHGSRRCGRGPGPIQIRGVSAQQEALSRRHNVQDG